MSHHAYSTLGENIRQLRHGHDLSQEAFAERCDLHRTYISDVENGVRNVTLGTLLKIAQGLGTTVSELTKNVEQDFCFAKNPPASPAAMSVKLMAVVLVLILAQLPVRAQSLLEGIVFESALAASILQVQTDTGASGSDALVSGNVSANGKATPASNGYSAGPSAKIETGGSVINQGVSASQVGDVSDSVSATKAPVLSSIRISSSMSGVFTIHRQNRRKDRFAPIDQKHESGEPKSSSTSHPDSAL